MTDDWLTLNRKNWDARTPIHLNSDFYDINAFKSGRSTLRPEEIEDLAPVTGKSLLHIQCHFGMDTLSWAREGATVTGLDFSEVAIKEAHKLAQEIGIEASFVTANVYDAPTVLNRQFDIVYTGIGALCWLPDIATWAECVAKLIKPGGQFYLLEFHPTAWMFEDSFTVQYNYFSPQEGEKIIEQNTYTNDAKKLSHAETRQWNHSIGEVVTSLINAGLTITELRESTECVMAYLPNMERQENGRYKVSSNLPTPPLMYTLRAKKVQTPKKY